jgi:hypothetical protein
LRRIILEELNRELANEGVMDSFKAAGQSIGRIFDKEAKKWDVGGSGWQELRDLSLQCSKEWSPIFYNEKHPEAGNPGRPLNKNSKCNAEIRIPNLIEYRNDPGIDEETPFGLALDASNAMVLKSIKMWLKGPKNQRKYDTGTMNEMFGGIPDPEESKDPRKPYTVSRKDRKNKIQKVVNFLNRIASSKLEDEEQ